MLLAKNLYKQDCMIFFLKIIFFVKYLNSLQFTPVNTDYLQLLESFAMYPGIKFS